MQKDTWRNRLHLQGWRLWLLLAILAYTLIGFFLLPWIIERQLVKFGETRLQRPLNVEQVRFNPYSLALTINGLKLDEADGTALAALGEFNVNFEASSLFRWAWTFSDLRLTEPYLNFVRYSEGDNNLRRLAATLAETAPPAEPDTATAEEESEPPRLILQHFLLERGALDVDDRSHVTNFQTRVEPIDLELFSFNTLPNKEGEHSFKLVTETGAEITWTGRLQPNPTRLIGRIDAIGERPRLIWRYIQDDVDFEIADGLVTLALDVSITQTDGPPHVLLENIEYTLTDLLLRPKGVEQDVLKLGQFALSGGRVDVSAQTVHLEDVRFEGADLMAFRDEAGVLNIVDLLQPGDGAAANPAPTNESADDPTAASSTADAAPATTAPTAGDDSESSEWTITLARLAVTDFGASFEDRTWSRPLQTGVEDLELVVTDFSSEPGTAFTIDLDTGISSGGRISADGQVALDPQSVTAKIEVDALSLEPLESMIGDHSKMTLKSGTLNVNGTMQHDASETLAFSGSAQIDELATEDTILNERFVAWKRLSMPSIEFALDGGSLLIDTVDFDALYGKLTVKDDGTTNINDIFPSDPDATAEAEPATATADDTPAPLKIDVNTVTISEGSANFADMSLPLPFATAVHSMSGEIGNISSHSGEPATVNIDGTVDESGSADIDGELDPFAPTDFLKMDVVFKNVHMPRLSPYSAKFAGREIENGKLSLDLQYRIENGQLDSKNNFVIDQLTLGKKVDSEEAANLPLDLAVALLKDSNGRIDLDLPVTGDLNDPEFHYGSVVWKAFGNILMKAVTAPFKLLGALIPGGGDGEKLEFINFAPGSAELSEEETADLDTIAEAMAKRPQLILKVPAAYSATTDRKAIQRARVEQKVQVRLAAVTARDGVSAERLALEQIYKEEFSKTELENLEAANTRSADGGGDPQLDEDAYLAALRGKLEEDEVVATPELQLLADQRAQAIMDYLLQTAGAPAAQLSKNDITTVEPDAEGRIQLKFEVDSDGAAAAATTEPAASSGDG